MSEEFWLSLWNPESYLKVLLVILSYPLWGPIVKIMWEEFQEAMAPEGGVFGRREKRDIAIRPPGANPWLNVPLAKHRGRMGGPSRTPTVPGRQAAGADGRNERGGALRKAQGAGRTNAGSRATTPAGPRRRTF